MSVSNESGTGLARAILARGDVMILDEPAAHLDARTARDVLTAVVTDNRADRRSTLILGHHAQFLDEDSQVLSHHTQVAGRIVQTA